MSVAVIVKVEAWSRNGSMACPSGALRNGSAVNWSHLACK